MSKHSLRTAVGFVLNINGHDIYVEDHGQPQDRVLILLHHGLGSTRAWKYQIEPFVSAGYRVIAYDRWGYGKSEPRMRFSMPTFEEDIADLRSLMDEFGLQHVSLIGHSDGGTISLYFASQYPQLITSLTTIAAHIYVEDKMLPGIEALQRAYENERVFRVGLRRIHGDGAERVFYNWFNGWHRQEVVDWDMRPQLKRIKCPALIIQGSDDEHATVQHARDLADALPNAELWIVKGARHMLVQDEAESFNRRVLDFLDDVYK